MGEVNPKRLDVRCPPTAEYIREGNGWEKMCNDYRYLGSHFLFVIEPLRQHLLTTILTTKSSPRVHVQVRTIPHSSLPIPIFIIIISYDLPLPLPTPPRPHPSHSTALPQTLHKPYPSPSPPSTSSYASPHAFPFHNHHSLKLVRLARTALFPSLGKSAVGWSDGVASLLSLLLLVVVRGCGDGRRG